jgi:DNA-binding transcriptional LysR family regulator
MRSDLSDLATFAIIAEERSFTRAAQRLRVSQSALSHSMRGLEKRLGLQLLARTTRSVSPTAAGNALLKDLVPALEQIDRSLNGARRRRDHPVGRVRLIMPHVAASMVLMPKLANFVANYPEIALDVTTSNDPIDIVASGYDAGIQIGEYIQRDMIAVRVSENLRLVAFGSPDYFESHPIPRTPRDLKDHSCIAFRHAAGVYRWEFEKGRRALTVTPQGPLIFDDSDLVTEAALNGVGLGMALEAKVSGSIADGHLVQVLSDWCPSFPGFYLYYPSRRNQPAALSALIRAFRIAPATAKHLAGGPDLI